MKLSVNKPARNCVTIQLVLTSEFDFGPEKLPDLSRNGPQVPKGRLALTQNQNLLFLHFTILRIA